MCKVKSKKALSKPYLSRMASKNFLEASRRSIAMGPCVRNLLSHYGLDPSRIVSTGPHQVILKSDVVAYITQHKLQPNQGQRMVSGNKSGQSRAITPNLDTTGYQPRSGPEGFSKIAKELLGN